MFIEQVRFSRVFDAQPYGVFSFESGERTVYDVHLRSGVIPAAGATFDIAFLVPGDWESVVAWRDLASNTVTVRETPWESVLANAGYLCWSSAGFMLAGFGLAGGLGILAALPVSIGIALGDARALVRTHRTAREALLPAVAAPQAGGLVAA